MHSDHPTLNDQLQRLHVIQGKAAEISKCIAPQTFGIHGDWGSGKTSFLRQLRLHLDGSRDGASGEPHVGLEPGVYKDHIVTVWFDAWRYQHEQVPVIALLQEVRRQFTTWAAFQKKAGKLLEVSVRTVLNGLDDVAKLMKYEGMPLNPSKIQDIGEKWEKEHLETRLGVDTIQSFLENSIDTILKALLGKVTHPKVVILIDDLDRCSADSAYKLLEGLKIYLGLRNCVFIIGMNQQLVVDAIASCMPKELAPQDAALKEAAFRVRAEAYLEKMCTNLERLTPPSDLRSIICSWVSLEFSPRLKHALTDAQGDFIRCLPPNPRRLKALANLLSRWIESADTVIALDEQTRIRSLVVIAYTYQFHSELFQRWQFNPGFFSRIVEWSTKVWPDPKALPPYFAGLKLPDATLPGSQTSEVPQSVTQSTYPDPYAPDIFWVSPLIREAGLLEVEINQVLKAVTGPL